MTTGERVALQGLMMCLVEIQNLVRATHVHEDLDAFEKIEELVESPQANEHIQLARSLLDAPPAPAAIPAAAAGIHN